MKPSELARKAVEQGLRELGQAPEQRAGRRLAAEWAERGGQPVDGARVAILTPRSWASHVQTESVLAHALALRGASVTMISCGGGLAQCDRTNVHEGPPMPCRSCRAYTDTSIDAHGHRRVSLFDGEVDQEWPELDELSAADLLDVEEDGIALGRLIDIPSQWFLLTTRPDEPLMGRTRRAFLRSARAIARAIAARLDELDVEHLVVLNGGFLFESIASAVARARGIDVVSYERGFRHGTLFLSRERPAIDYDVTEAFEARRDVPLTAAQEERLDGLLADRRGGATHFIPMSPDGTPTIPEVEGTTFLLFTNLTWDSAVIHREIAFPDVRAWITACIDEVGARPADQLIIRIHPAERKLSGKETREPFGALIEELHPDLPGNVTVLGSEDPTSSYALMDLADVGLVYTSTTGLEMVLGGKPVVVAAKTHYRDKGFTVDVDDPAHFSEVLAAMGADPGAFAPDLTTARRYANAFFFARLLPAWFVTEPVPGLARVAVDDLSAIAPGADPVIDVITAGILDGEPFEFE